MVDTMIEAAMAGAPRGMTWAKNGVLDQRLRGDAYILMDTLACEQASVRPARVGTGWTAQSGDWSETYRTADRAMVSVNLRLGPQPERTTATPELGARWARDPQLPAFAAVLRAAVATVEDETFAASGSGALANAAMQRAGVITVSKRDVELLLEEAGYLPGLGRDNARRIRELVSLMDRELATLDRTRLAEVLREATLILRSPASAGITAPQLAAAALNAASGPAPDMDNVVLLLRVCSVGQVREDYAIQAVNAVAALIEAHTDDEVQAACEQLARDGR
jgi:hypothetical protein